LRNDTGRLFALYAGIDFVEFVDKRHKVDEPKNLNDVGIGCLLWWFLPTFLKLPSRPLASSLRVAGRALCRALQIPSR
jgi:hypothetical protein